MKKIVFIVTAGVLTFGSFGFTGSKTEKKESCCHAGASCCKEESSCCNSK